MSYRGFQRRRLNHCIEFPQHFSPVIPASQAHSQTKACLCWWGLKGSGNALRLETGFPVACEIWLKRNYPRNFYLHFPQCCYYIIVWLQILKCSQSFEILTTITRTYLHQSKQIVKQFSNTLLKVHKATWYLLQPFMTETFIKKGLFQHLPIVKIAKSVIVWKPILVTIITQV